MTDSAVASPGRHDEAAGAAPWPEVRAQRLEDLARAVFVPGGVLSRAAESFLPRSGQT
jgi:ATP-dependent DNA helicase DinG